MSPVQKMLLSLMNVLVSSPQLNARGRSEIIFKYTRVNKNLPLRSVIWHLGKDGISSVLSIIWIEDLEYEVRFQP